MVSISVIMGFTIDGGIYAAILNLYILRLNFRAGIRRPNLVRRQLDLCFRGALRQAGWAARYGDRRIAIVGLSLATLGMHAAHGRHCPIPGGLVRACRRPAPCLHRAVVLLVNSGFLIRATAAAARGNIFALQSALGGVAGFAGGLLGGLLPALFAAILPCRRPILGRTAKLPLLVVGISMAVAVVPDPASARRHAG